VKATRTNLMRLAALPYKVSEIALSSSDPDSELSTDSDPSLRYLYSGLLASGAPRLPSRYSPFHHPSLRGFRRQRRARRNLKPELPVAFMVLQRSSAEQRTRRTRLTPSHAATEGMLARAAGPMAGPGAALAEAGLRPPAASARRPEGPLARGGPGRPPLQLPAPACAA
jgi:hypothetical protein